jgi:hypothetical protein
MKFPKFRWKDQKRQVITYIGDSIKLDVRASPGRG